MLEEIGVFYRGLVLGVMISAPVGPIGLLCIRRTIQKGLLIGFATGMGAAFADTVFAAVAALGISAIIDFMKHYDAIIRIIGGSILLYGAWHTWFDDPEPPPNLLKLAGKIVNNTDDSMNGSLKAFISGIAITLTNPLTIFAVLAVIATFGNLDTSFDATILVAGVFFGAAAWWLALSGGISLVRCHFTESRILMINRITAVLLASLAFWAIVSGCKRLFAMFAA